MSKWLITLLLALFCCSCRQNGAPFHVSTFHDFPVQDGCTCTFSESKKGFDKGNYIFASDFDSIANVSIDNQMLKLKLTGSNQNDDDTTSTQWIDTFSNGEYKVIIKATMIKDAWEETETTQWKGEMKVEKDGNTVTKQFTGECGC